MNKIYNPTRNTWSKLLQRPTANFNDMEETDKGICKEVQSKGDEGSAY